MKVRVEFEIEDVSLSDHVCDQIFLHIMEGFRVPKPKKLSIFKNDNSNKQIGWVAVNVKDKDQK